MTNTHKRITRNRANRSFLATFYQAEHRREAVQEPEESQNTAFDADTEGTPSKLITRQARFLAVKPSIFNPWINTELKDTMRKPAVGEPKRIFVEQAGPSI